jgi:hypothetical protein
MAVMYLFTRYRFNWNEVDFSLFSTYGMITNLFGKFKWNNKHSWDRSLSTSENASLFQDELISLNQTHLHSKNSILCDIITRRPLKDNFKLAVCFILNCYLAHSSSLKKETIYLSETSIYTNQEIKFFVTTLCDPRILHPQHSFLVHLFNYSIRAMETSLVKLMQANGILDHAGLIINTMYSSCLPNHTD